MTIALIWQTDTIELPDLEPPYSLTAGYNASLTLMELVNSPAFKSMNSGLRAGIQQWVTGGKGERGARERQAIVTDAQVFLKGLRVVPETFTETEINAAYRRGYLLYIKHDPMAQAALMIARVILTDHPLAEWVDVPLPLLDCLPGS